MTAPACSRTMTQHHGGDRAQLWGACESGAGDVETIEFLYALVRLVKPKACLEIGTGHGTAARAIGEALRDNGRGWLKTVEIDPSTATHTATAAAICAPGLPIEFILGDVGAIEQGAFDFVFIDSGEPEDRLNDLVTLRPRSVGLVAVHDTALYEGLGKALRALPDFRCLTLPTPLGLTLGEWAR